MPAGGDPGGGQRATRHRRRRGLAGAGGDDHRRPVRGVRKPGGGRVRAPSRALRGHHRGDSVGRGRHRAAPRACGRGRDADHPFLRLRFGAQRPGDDAGRGAPPESRHGLRRGGLRVPSPRWAQRRDRGYGGAALRERAGATLGAPLPAQRGRTAAAVARGVPPRARPEGGALERGSPALARAVLHGDGQHPGGEAERDARRGGRRALWAALRLPGVHGDA